ncbi:unnamed protein product, partial [marine sediment metagenome]
KIRENKTKLHLAMVELYQDTVFARGNFEDCQTCGCARAGQLRESRHHGYCFWHEQDEETIEATGHVYLSFGIFDEMRDAFEVGVLIVRTLWCQGLAVQWNGDVATRIQVVLGMDKILLEGRKVAAYREMGIA